MASATEQSVPRPGVRRRRGGRRPAGPRVWLLHGRALFHEFRWTLLALLLAVVAGGLLYGITPHAQLNGRRPPARTALYAGWTALLAQPILTPPETWYLTLLCVFYPVLGFVLIGEGVVRLA